MEGRYHLNTVHVVPYTKPAADWLLTLLKSACAQFAALTLKPFNKYLILNDPWKRDSRRDDGDKSSEDDEDGRLEDFDCSLPLNFTLNELQLVRVETRVHHAGHSTNRITEGSAGNTGQGRARRHTVRELLLGDVHTELSERQRHRPTSFQESLRDAQRSLCGVCSRVSNSHELDPPRLGVHQGTLLSLEGEWVSTRCESRQYGQFLTRWLHFLADGQSWEGRYDYYHDALCRQPAFTLRAKGSYAGGQESEAISGSKAYSFKTTRLKVTPRDVPTAENLNRYEGSECGRAGQWKVDKEQDVTNTAGCVTLGIRLPTLEQDLMRMEAVHRKLLLYVGQRSSDQPVRPYHVPPPSAFQSPLVKCDAQDLDMSINSLPEERAHALAMTSMDSFEEDAVKELAGLSEATMSRSCGVVYVVLLVSVAEFVIQNNTNNNKNLLKFASVARAINYLR
nr:hypothetical protein BaRGS_014053 [Batillaria attramentaria]